MDMDRAVEPYGGHREEGSGTLTRTTYADSDRAVADRAPEVELAFQSLDETYIRTDELVSQLEYRLGPILSADHNEKVAGSEPRPGYSTPLAQKVGNSAEQFDRLNRRVAMLLDRVEV